MSNDDGHVADQGRLRTPARHWLAACLAPLLALLLGVGIFALRERADDASEAQALFAQAQGQIAAINQQLESGSFVLPKGAELPPPVLPEGDDQFERLIAIGSPASAAAVEALRSLMESGASEVSDQPQRFSEAQDLLDQAVVRESERADNANLQADLGTVAALILGSLGLVGLFWYFDRLRKRDIAAHLAELEWQALHDPLTGLGNRRKLEADFERLSRPPHSVAAVMVVDLDRFKHFNDNFGHEAGDQLLTEVAIELSTRLGSKRLYRIGGDEFCVLADEELVGEIDMSEICQALSTRADISASWGLVELAACPTSLREGLRRADQAMYAHKRRNRAVVTDTVVADAAPIPA